MNKDIFKVGIYESQIVADDTGIVSSVKSLEKNDPVGREVSNYGGWQSFEMVNSEDQSIRDLIQTITNISQIYLARLDICSKVRINSMWANVNRYKDYNVVHDHYGAAVSGVYYAQVPSDSGLLTFRNPFCTHVNGFWGNVEKNTNNYTSVGYRVKPEVNKIVLFPSWLEHSVEPSQNETEERISIAFNLGVYNGE